MRRRADSRAWAQSATLSPGEVLWLPSFWWHHVKQPPARDESCSNPNPNPASGDEPSPGSPDENLSLNFWCNSAAGSLQPFEWLSMRGPAVPRKVEAFWAGAGGGGAQAVRDELPALLEGGGGDRWDAELTAAPRAEELTTDPCYPAESLQGRTVSPSKGALPALTVSPVRCVHAARMAESAATVVCGSAEAGGRLLNAVARGADHGWPPSSRARAFAARLREELQVAIGEPSSVDALLHLIVRDGRLHPGLAPPVEGTIVSSEAGDLTPPDELARLFATDGG